MWTILANVLSAGMCVALLFLVLYLRQEAPELRRVLTPYRGPLQLFALGGSVVLFIIAFGGMRTLVQPSESIEPLIAT